MMVFRKGPLGLNEAYHLPGRVADVSKDIREKQTKLGRALCV